MLEAVTITKSWRIAAVVGLPNGEKIVAKAASQKKQGTWSDNTLNCPIMDVFGQ